MLDSYFTCFLYIRRKRGTLEAHFPLKRVLYTSFLNETHISPLYGLREYWRSNHAIRRRRTGRRGRRRGKMVKVMPKKKGKKKGKRQKEE